MDYFRKYIKYKKKYTNLQKKQVGGSPEFKISGPISCNFRMLKNKVIYMFGDHHHSFANLCHPTYECGTKLVELEEGDISWHEAKDECKKGCQDDNDCYYISDLIESIMHQNEINNNGYVDVFFESWEDTSERSIEKIGDIWKMDAITELHKTLADQTVPMYKKKPKKEVFCPLIDAITYINEKKSQYKHTRVNNIDIRECSLYVSLAQLNKLLSVLKHALEVHYREKREGRIIITDKTLDYLMSLIFPVYGKDPFLGKKFLQGNLYYFLTFMAKDFDMKCTEEIYMPLLVYNLLKECCDIQESESTVKDVIDKYLKSNPKPHSGCLYCGHDGINKLQQYICNFINRLDDRYTVIVENKNILKNTGSIMYYLDELNKELRILFSELDEFFLHIGTYIMDVHMLLRLMRDDVKKVIIFAGHFHVFNIRENLQGAEVYNVERTISIDNQSNRCLDIHGISYDDFINFRATKFLFI